MATFDKDFRVKNGIVVEGSTATVNGNNVLTTASSLDSLNDVTIASNTPGEFLVWNGSAWINQTVSEAGLVSGVGTAKISYQTTAPSSPTTGDIWIDSDGDADIQEQTITIPLSDELSVLTTGTGVVYWRAPFAMTLTQIPRASLTTASTSGPVTVDINEGTTSVLGANKLSIDQSELTSTTAATATTLADTSIADDASIRFDIDAAGTNATGLKVTLYYRKT